MAAPKMLERRRARIKATDELVTVLKRGKLKSEVRDSTGFVKDIPNKTYKFVDDDDPVAKMHYPERL